MQSVPGTLRLLRLLYVALVLSMVLYPFVAETIARPERAPNPFIFAGLLFESVAVAGAGIWFQLARVRPALETLQLRPDDLAALQAWRTGSVVCAVLFESIVLIGFILRFLGGTLAQSAVFYIGGIALMFTYWPHEP